MRFYSNPQQYYAGIDQHARSMNVCVLDKDGMVVYDRNLPCHFPTLVTRAALEKAVGKLAERCGEQEQVELLKHPFCVGASRDGVRAALNKRLKQNFRTHWALVAWLRQHRPDLNLTSPP